MRNDRERIFWMNLLFLECGMGAAGDMLTAALFELLDDKEKESFLRAINATGLGQVTAEPSVKQGIAGTHIRVSIDGEEEQTDFMRIEKEHNDSQTGVSDILERINALTLPDAIKTNAAALYQRIAEAEAEVHSLPITKIHYHELGSRDALLDILGVCMLMEKLQPQEIVISPVHVGSGYVRCTHGLLPVPAPATAVLLRGVPVYGGDIQGELCTPTGAALLRHFAQRFGAMPEMSIQKIGYGMGHKDFKAVNCVRAFWGQTLLSGTNGRAAELRCNLDDMTGEAIGYACSVLWGEGAWDVYTTPIYMKKDRPGVLLTCLCAPEQADAFAGLMLKHTTTFGVRKTVCERYTLDRRFTIQNTPTGTVRIKHGSGYGVTKSKPEYDDVARSARLSGESFVTERELPR
jgi:uncharacterized protein (TIGR00299 family) protein